MFICCNTVWAPEICTKTHPVSLAHLFHPSRAHIDSGSPAGLGTMEPGTPAIANRKQDVQRILPPGSWLTIACTHLRCGWEQRGHVFLNLFLKPLRQQLHFLWSENLNKRMVVDITKGKSLCNSWGHPKSDTCAKQWVIAEFTLVHLQKESTLQKLISKWTFGERQDEGEGWEEEGREGEREFGIPGTFWFWSKSRSSRFLKSS